MRLPHLRFTVRHLMVAVAIMALVFWVDLWRRRYPYCQSNAVRCASEEGAHLYLAASHDRISALYRKHAKDPRGSARYNNEQAALFSRAAWGERAKAKSVADRGEAFRRAARYPWISIPPEEVDPLGIGFTNPESR